MSQRQPINTRSGSKDLESSSTTQTRSLITDTSDIPTHEGITLKSIHELITNMRVEITTLREDIRAEFRQQTDTLQQKIDSQRKEITSLMQVVSKQAGQIDYLESLNRADSIIIYGIPELNNEGNPTDLGHYVSQLTTTLQLPSILNPEFIPTRLGKKSNKPRPVKVKVKTVQEKIKLVTKARTQLKTIPAYKNVFINFDESPISRKENARLRAKVKELRQLHPDKVVKIVKRNLLVDNVTVDSFDLSNQIF